MKTRFLFSTIAILFSFVIYGQKRPKISKLFSVSPTYAQFTYEGGSKVFIVKANSPWKISTNTKSWGHLVKSGNTLTLTVDANTGQSSRSDYFEIVSGEKRIRISISQTGDQRQIDDRSPKAIKQTYSYDIACKRLLRDCDIIGLSKKELRIMRNWIYARHGYSFRSQDLINYFSKFEWYHPKYSEVPFNLLTDIEQRNIELIKRYE